MQKETDYAVCEFTIVGGGPEIIYNGGEEARLDGSTIIEFAAVKLRAYECVEQFHTFAQFEGIAPEATDFVPCPPFRGVTPSMLLGAPKLEDALKAFHAFTKGCTLVLRDEWPQEPLKTLRRCGRRYGLRFPHPVARISDVVTAADAIRQYFRIGKPDILKIAASMQDACAWKDLFAKYAVPFEREDCVGYVHAFAALIAKLADELDLPF